MERMGEGWVYGEDGRGLGVWRGVRVGVWRGRVWMGCVERRNEVCVCVCVCVSV